MALGDELSDQRAGTWRILIEIAQNQHRRAKDNPGVQALHALGERGFAGLFRMKIIPSGHCAGSGDQRPRDCGVRPAFAAIIDLNR
ncbi:hypothetical protein [Acidibrevibacterium fodinaquatile]|uniref:hypothetical protein n=1 Tax=Acidibrevibacterium fodinaquatile TaxID=1969806 RepID=UPI001962963F|nr:hypothetical protein [Acidibrevibacterium fodinaquatile]